MSIETRPYTLGSAEWRLIGSLSPKGRTLSARALVAGTAVGSLAITFLVAPFGDDLALRLFGEAGEGVATGPWIAFALFAAVMFWFAVMFDRASRRMSVPDHPAQRVTFAPDGVDVASERCASRFSWSAWVRCHDRPEALALEEPSGVFLVVPASAFASAEAHREAVALAMARVPSATALTP